MSNEALGFRVYGCSKWGTKALGQHSRVVTLYIFTIDLGFQ